MRNLFADIIISNTNVDRPFTYIIPQSLVDSVVIGCPVLIELRRKVKKGYVVDIRESTDLDISKLKPILSISEKELSTDENLLQLAIWLKYRYGVNFSRAIATVMPVKLRAEEKTSNEIFLNIENNNIDNWIEKLKKSGKIDGARV